MNKPKKKSATYLTKTRADNRGVSFSVVVESPRGFDCTEIRFSGAFPKQLARFCRDVFGLLSIGDIK